MTAQIIDGKEIAARIREGLARDIAGMDTVPGLAVIMVGNNPASQVYVAGKVKACAEIGIKSYVHHLPETASTGEVFALIDALNDNPDVHGILPQMPMPPQIDTHAVITRIDPRKDVDGLHPENLGLLLSGRPRLTPCTPQGVMVLLEQISPHLSGMSAAVIGRSVLVGRPMGQMLLSADCTVTYAHSRTRDLADVVARADIVVAAAGMPRLITAAMVKPGAIVIDVGITRGDDGKLVGDVDFENVRHVARAITPVPGGVGPMTVACLMKNTINAAKK